MKELPEDHPLNDVLIRYEQWLSIEISINKIMKDPNLNTFQKAIEIHRIIEVLISLNNKL